MDQAERFMLYEEQEAIENLWSSRHVVTCKDEDFLSECGVAWGYPVEDYMVPQPLDWTDERTCIRFESLRGIA
jgi:hypothetical protein